MTKMHLIWLTAGCRLPHNSRELLGLASLCVKPLCNAVAGMVGTL